VAVKRIAIVIELAVGYREDVLRGLLRFVQAKPDWVYQGCELRNNELLALRKWKPDGIVVGFHDIAMASPLRKLRVPIVDVYNWLDLPGAARVGIDDDAVGRMAAEHFLQRGFKHVAMIGETSALYSAQRRDGFLRTIEEAGIVCDRIGQVAVPTVSWSIAFRTTSDATLRAWLRRLPKPTGIFATDDDWALTLSGLCNQEGLRVPDDLAILGVDNEELLCQMSRPPLSSVATGAERVGWHAGSVLAQLMDGQKVPNPILLPPVRVVERQSTDIFAIDDQEVLTAVRYIQANAHLGIDVTEVLRTVPTRRRTLEYRFRQLIGRSILEEIQRSRVSRAKTLLITTDLKLSVVAQRSGFGNAGHLCRVFRQVTGDTPASFRSHQALA
jgi:LacI family transcriptional regulator